MDEALHRIDAVLARTGLGRSALYAAVAAGRFPAPLKRGACSVWVKSEIDQWIAEEIRRLPRMGPSMGRRRSEKKKAAKSAA